MELISVVVLIFIFIFVLASYGGASNTKLPKYDGTTPVCPRCKKSNYHTVSSTEVVIPGKTKTQSSLNLNPLKPFTIVNHKEKMVRREVTRQVVKYMCNECGNIWG